MYKKFLLSIFLYSFVIGQAENIVKGANQDEFNETSLSLQKMEDAKRLSDNAVKHIQNVPIQDACYDFIYNPIWRKGGDLYVAVFDQDGICLAHGDEMFFIWKNIKRNKAFGGARVFKEMLNAGSKGQEISYIWNNSYKSSYVRSVTKEGISYVIEVGFYPKDNQYITKEIVTSVKLALNSYPKNVTLSLINDPQGPFAKNDITTLLFDMKGKCIANNQNSGFINQNLLDLKDSDGTKIVRKFLKVAKEKGSGWVNFTWQNAPTQAYVEKVLAPKDADNITEEHNYVIVSNYYPNQGIDVTQDFVNRAVSFLKNNGPEVAFKAFSDKVGNFVKGGLSIFAYDLQGHCLANWDDPSLVGQNLINRTDDEGHFVTKEIINLAKTQGRGIVTYYIKNSTAISYIQLVNTPNGPFILGCEFYPESKAEYIRTLVEKATNFLINNEMAVAFDQFTKKTSSFLKGDAYIFVYTTDGRRLVNGSAKDGIWRNYTESTDQQGLPIVQDIISTGLNGGGWIKYHIRNGIRRVFSKAVTKQDKAGNPQTYIIGSGYFV